MPRMNADAAVALETLLAGIKARGFDEAQSSARFALSLDLLTGRKQLYHQQPKFYLFPGLPQVQLQPRADTPWLAGIEAAAAARIPPHPGLINTRLICPLPLVAPPGSWFRVGSDLRQWEEGKAWAFDDTIEHEAWNDSDQDRTILIFDVWKPEITEEERWLIRALFDAIDAGGGATPKLGT